MTSATPELPLLPLTVRVNGAPRALLVAPARTLLDVLRTELGLTGAKMGCDDGNCGACTVHVDGRAVKSCLMLAHQARGRDVVTIEGIGTEERLHPLQQAFVDRFAVQCGYCTPGMIMTAKALLDAHPEATEADIRRALYGTICRCTGYVKIIEAVEAARDALASTTRPDRP
jgi:aerobic-type carbon monoxide dehydrogenase small subunit (CoxS/CutS family)